ncbi:MAG: hypothetical protein P8J87_21325, partial [Verrucomicrobiales bacterium]|nr:hypothetical protein [Verrucomicrobiales bacterium]
WRRSLSVHGTPGGRGGFFGDADADDDGDGQSAFAEYAFGSSDADAGESGALVILSGLGDGVVAVGFVSNADAVDVEYVIERSEDLVFWETAVLGEAEVEHLGGGRQWNRYATDGVGEGRRPVFLRVRVVSVAGR